MSYKAGILEAIAALNDGGAGSSQSAIKNHMQDKLPADKKWLNATFLSALKKLVADGDLKQTRNSYKLSTANKEKQARAVAKAGKKMEKEMQSKISRKSESNLTECAGILMECLNNAGTVRKETAMAALTSRLNCLPKEDRMLAVPAICAHSGYGFDELEGRDKTFQETIEAASEGNWSIFVVDTHRVDATEEKDSGDVIAQYDGEIEIDEICRPDGSQESKDFFDGLNIIWLSVRDGGVVCCYEDSSIWESGNGDREQISGPKSDDECDDNRYYDDYAGYEDDEGRMFEETLSESFIFAISNSLLPGSK